MCACVGNENSTLSRVSYEVYNKVTSIYHAVENSCSSLEYLPLSGSLGGGPFTTALSCSNIVAHMP